jgi:hypothetical protein
MLLRLRPALVITGAVGLALGLAAGCAASATVRQAGAAPAAAATPTPGASVRSDKLLDRAIKAMAHRGFGLVPAGPGTEASAIGRDDAVQRAHEQFPFARDVKPRVRLAGALHVGGR